MELPCKSKQKQLHYWVVNIIPSSSTVWRLEKSQQSLTAGRTENWRNSRIAPVPTLFQQRSNSQNLGNLPLFIFLSPCCSTQSSQHGQLRLGMLSTVSNGLRVTYNTLNTQATWISRHRRKRRLYIARKKLKEVKSALVHLINKRTT